MVLWLEGHTMATYEQIQGYLNERYGFVAQTCWIADIKAEHGLTTRIASNRISESNRAKRCPAGKRDAIENALRHFGMI